MDPFRHLHRLGILDQRTDRDRALASTRTGNDLGIRSSRTPKVAALRSSRWRRVHDRCTLVSDGAPRRPRIFERVLLSTQHRKVRRRIPSQAHLVFLACPSHRRSPMVLSNNPLWQVLAESRRKVSPPTTSCRRISVAVEWLVLHVFFSVELQIAHLSFALRSGTGVDGRPLPSHSTRRCKSS